MSLTILNKIANTGKLRVKYLMMLKHNVIKLLTSGSLIPGSLVFGSLISDSFISGL